MMILFLILLLILSVISFAKWLYTQNGNRLLTFAVVFNAVLPVVYLMVKAGLAACRISLDAEMRWLIFCLITYGGLCLSTILVAECQKNRTDNVWWLVIPMTAYVVIIKLFFKISDKLAFTYRFSEEKVEFCALCITVVMLVLMDILIVKLDECLLKYKAWKEQVVRKKNARMICFTAGMMPMFEVIMTDAPDEIIEEQLRTNCEKRLSQEVISRIYELMEEQGYIVQMIGNEASMREIPDEVDRFFDWCDYYSKENI